jgi:glycosyltransferase involved in cell wall biosynthesis
MTPAFSIVIPTYNRAALLPRALESVLAQSERDFECIVVDDGSSDATAAVVREYPDARIRYQVQTNAGVSAARNAGAKLASGDHLLFLDSDDELVPDAVERFAEAAQTNRWSVVLSGWTRVSSDGRRRRVLTPTRSGAAPQLLGPFLPGAFVIARSVFGSTGGYDEHLRFSENTVLGWRVRSVVAATGVGMGMIREPLVVRYSQPERGFDQARYAAAVRILDHYSDLLADPATGAASFRKRRANYLGIAGAGAASLGLHREAWRYSFAALRSDPGSLARYRGVLGVARATLLQRRGYVA